MSFFDYKGKCPICGAEVSFKNMSTIKYHNENLCLNCVKKLTSKGISNIYNISQKNIEELRQLASSTQTNNIGSIPTKNNIPNKPRKAMKTWAIVCFVFACIYALLAFSEGTAMLAAATLFGVLGVMFVVLHKSPKENSYILGKNSGITKKAFVIICVVLAFFGTILFAETSPENIEGSSSSDSENSPVSTEDNSTTPEKHNVSFIGNFKETEHELLIGESLDFSVEIKPKELTENDIVIEVENPNVISVSGVEFKSSWFKTTLNFKCTASSEGETTLVVKSANGKKTSNTITIKATTPPIVTSISRFGTSYAVQEVGDKRTLTVYMNPADLTSEDVNIINSDTNIIQVSNVLFATENDTTVLTFDVTGVGVGSASIKIQGADGKTESNELTFTINEKDTSPTVYVTPYGERYHYSSACAGKNASATTRNKAIRSGKTGCGKCT